MWSAEHVLEALQGQAAQPQVCQFEGQVGFVQHTDDHFLSENGRHGRDPQIDLPPVGNNVYPAFLRQTFLGNVHLAYYFDPRNDRGVHACRRRHQQPELAVQAIPNSSAFAGGLEVDVTGPVAHGRQNHQAHQIHDRAAIDHLVQVRERTFVDGFDFRNLNVALFNRS